MNCPLCHSPRTLSYYKADMPHILSACPADALRKVKVLPFEARLCLRCSVGFNATPPSPRILKSIYDGYNYISPRKSIGTTKYAGMLATIKRHLLPADTILDVGCSEGYLLEQLRDAGYTRLFGIEPGPQAEEARGAGLEVLRGYFHARSFPGKRFDGIVLMHVFEHLADPVGMLKALKGKLSSQGKLIIEVPDFEGYHHQHLFFYTLLGLNELCKKIGLGIVYALREAGTLRVVMMEGYVADRLLVNPNTFRRDVKARALSLMRDFCGTRFRLRSLFRSHRHVYWWGAGSASVFWLNQIGAGLLKRTDLTVVDGDSARWGLWIPGVNVEVEPFGELSPGTVDLMVIASEFADEIKATMRAHQIRARRVEVVI